MNKFIVIMTNQDGDESYDIVVEADNFGEAMDVAESKHSDWRAVVAYARKDLQQMMELLE